MHGVTKKAECVQFGGLANIDCIKVEHGFVSDMFKLFWSIMEIFFILSVSST